ELNVKVQSPSRICGATTVRAKVTWYAVPTGQSSFGANSSDLSDCQRHVPASFGVTSMPSVTSLPTLAIGATPRPNSTTSGLGFCSFSISVRVGSVTLNATVTGFGRDCHHCQPYQLPP